ncbi:alpha/beta fold hydrolase [Halomonas urumqiensis]|uniref:Alpha/beta hydrolase n=1 Tax=Halomonas urumqiensis TaxID=1684789 RepID=A0A2N7UEJ3_9GAMM|nr:alpha/beta fold hydrolase [Halomonas urumqiensis]PMR78876.1 alpha/beta hydrolase [Halomonas urumqiensis]PTB04218.1 alpha/beta hydrolase [Halomonas urumqiensis]GHE19507.1 acyl-CoA esterase [Halomonas urumqiensis]
MSIELHHVDTGGDGVPLVVIHGLFGSADNWRSHVKSWQQRYRVIAVDLRNHGSSPHVEGMGYADMAEDVIRLLDSLDIPRAHLLGHSMGGKVVISLANLAPERVASLIVADIAPVAYGHGHDAVFAALHRVKEGRPANRREADALLAEHVDEKPTRLFLATNLVRGEQGNLELRVGLDEIQADYDSIMGLPAGDGPFQGPTLVLRGEHSHYVSDERMPDVRQALPEAELVTLQAGHWLHAEQPEAFRQAVDDFLARQAV